MRLSLITLLLLVACLAAFAQQASPSMVSADPINGKRGDTITVTGQNLGKDVVAKVYLTDGKNDIQVDVTDQSATAIKFKIPAKASGRLALMVLTAEKEPKYIEQPVKITIDE